jgi:hypothetical protein
MTDPQRALMLLAYHPVATDACGSHAAGGARCRDGGRLAGQEKEEDEGEERVLNKSYIKLGQQTWVHISEITLDWRRNVEQIWQTLWVKLNFSLEVIWTFGSNLDVV